MSHHKERKRKSPAFAIFLVAVVIATGLFANKMYARYMEYTDITQAIELTTKSIHELEKKNAKLLDEKENLNDLAYLEKVAREEHKMVAKDEVPVYIVDQVKSQKK